MMGWKIPLSDIDLGNEEIEEVTKVLKSKWLSMGPVTEKFEEEFTNYLGIKHAYGVSNGTAALHIAHKVLGIKEDDEVVVPSLTFVATANSVLYCGAKPVFADITSLDDLNISPDDILEKITKKTKAITIVHYGGHPCDMGAIMEIAEDHNLKVIEDAAHAPGAEYKGKKCGAIGDVGCFSFFANKNLVTGEGGMLVTNDDTLLEKIRIMRSHGMTTLTWDRHKGHAHSYDVVDMGFNYRINEVASAIGRVQLKKLDGNNEKRRRIVEEYNKRVGSISGISVPFRDHKEKPSCHIFPILLAEDVSRNGFIDRLKEKGIQTSMHYPPIHLFTHYRKMLGVAEGALPKTEFIGEHEVTLPLYPLMGKEEVKYIVEIINK
uniref:UDP-4-amino-4-deoxy-L-arabinose--oxoglutarate aminotransferase n=2 Tax=Candidatus Methanogaster sp. ANME-2c ERB4 TaxID=2759911 RepID=A0A7G9Y190_9EURY|nr:UDP-4-amino-4-deoxy-L-arabinose--oxoglutarate aminotransferase [Methanosarcinales archaeon ANME-2c ERB4]